jgi:bifunctional enzyme CysN/CysC
MTSLVASTTRTTVATQTAPAAETPPSTLRLLTCGSVDDGKSTLIGRLLHDTSLLMDDQLAALARDSARHGTNGDDLDFALLVDGLQDEREQGITIDVAYRFFATPRRRFIVADTPGHAQYTRNMATGASTADVAIVLVDARKGILTQTRRHAFIVSLLGIRHVVLAVNKIDTVQFSEERFKIIAEAFLAAVQPLGFASVMAIPLSARHGDNIATSSDRTPWYRGASLLGYLEDLDATRHESARPFRFPVQIVNHPTSDFRGYSGTVATGFVRPGDRVIVASTKDVAIVERIITMDGDRDVAGPDDAVTLVLDRQTDISRGEVLGAADAPPVMTDSVVANMVWLAETPLLQGRGYLFKIGTRWCPGTVTRIRYRVDPDSYEQTPADQLDLNDIGQVAISLGGRVAVESYADSRDLGGFIVVDRQTNATAGVGMIEQAGENARDVTWHATAIDKRARAAMKGQRPAILWFTGLSGSGKSTIANMVERKLYSLGRHTFILDGDNVRHGLNRDLGFSEADRVENIRRAAETSKLMAEAGLIVLVCFISPYRADRDAARELFEPGEFLEVFIDTPVEECRRRDPKGLYKRADAGLLKNFTGVDAPYESPTQPELRLRTTEAAPDALAAEVVQFLERTGVLL